MLIIAPKDRILKPCETDSEFFSEFFNDEFPGKNNYFMRVMEANYKQELVSGFWKYQDISFNDWQQYFERTKALDNRPPVFLREKADSNILLNPLDPSDIQKLIIDEISGKQRHRWFRSMSSSQALAQSVFANLKIDDRLRVLEDLKDDSGLPLFENVSFKKDSFKMEYIVSHLNEPRPTNLDAYFSGDYQVAIECKLSENGIGACSRPTLRKENSEYCDGIFTNKEMCPLSKLGIKYWDYMPDLFQWSDNTDPQPCPLRFKYQLVRNILAVCVQSDNVVPDKGHAVLIYDERNPAFQKGGAGYKSFEETKATLRKPVLLRKCSWQSIIRNLRIKNVLPWLTDDLKLKYGF